MSTNISGLQVRADWMMPDSGVAVLSGGVLHVSRELFERIAHGPESIVDVLRGVRLMDLDIEARAEQEQKAAEALRLLERFDFISKMRNEVERRGDTLVLCSDDAPVFYGTIAT